VAHRFSVVPHTHWDREWYHPFEYFQVRLAHTVDEVIDVLERDPEFASFTLDGSRWGRATSSPTSFSSAASRSSATC
jgi:alpha-mannosidase